MIGGHDLGGRHGFGPIDPEPEVCEPVFHSEWESRVFALTLAAGMLGQWNIDESRHARERQHPADYLRHSYYENWLVGLEKLLREKNLLDEVGSGKLRVPTPADARRFLATGGPTLVASDSSPVFAIGDEVRVRRMHTPGHTRAPAYAHGAVGSIAALRGCHIYPDRHAGGVRTGEQLYSVGFSAVRLWGGREDSAVVIIDLWEPYLEKVEDEH